MKNVTGKAYSISVFTPIKPWTTWLNKLIMWYASICIGRDPNSDLKKLSFIHFARWVVIEKQQLPRLSSDQPEEDLEHDILFFESNFNGTWDQYIDAFSDVIPSGLNLIWYWSERFPGSRPITPFKNYIFQNQVWTDYYFNATPGAATNDVKQGLHLRKAIKSFHNRTKSLPAEQFKQAYEQFLTEIQQDLSSTGSGPQLSLIFRQPALTGGE